MKQILLVLFLFTVIETFGQKNINFIDTRRKTESYAKMPTPNLRADLAMFTLAGIGESVAKEELQKLTSTSGDNSQMKFEGNGIQASVKIAPYDSAGHKFMYDDKNLIRIDKKTYFGGYGKLPRTHISEITLIVDGDTVEVPKTAYSDLYNLNLYYYDNGVKRSTNAIYTSKTGHLLYLYLFSKDINGGSYEVTLIFQNKKFLRRVLDYDLM